METLHGLRIIVVGATEPVGTAITEATLALGAEVVGTDIHRTRLDALRRGLDNHDRLRTVECDINDRPTLARFLGDQPAIDGLVDILPATDSTDRWDRLDAAMDAVSHLGSVVAVVPEDKLLDVPSALRSRGSERARFNVVSVRAGATPASVRGVIWLLGSESQGISGSTICTVEDDG